MAFRTDLALELCERAPDSGVQRRERMQDGFRLTETDILSDCGQKTLGLPVGHYRTLELDALTRREEDAFPRACGVLRDALRALLPEAAAQAPVLVVGLGNRAITPDAVGPLTVEHIVATRHLIEQEPEWFGSWRPVSAVAPGVLGQTGIETGEIVRGLVEKIAPCAVIAVDALACSRLSRLVRTVQLTDTGIVPGSGVGNARTALSDRELGVPVLALGVPTVVDGATLAHEITEQTHAPVCEALEDLAQPVLVTTRDIDREVRDIARVIGYAIDLALHPHLGITDIDLCLS